MKHSQEEYWRPRFHAPPLRSHPDPPPTIQCSWSPHEGQCPYMRLALICWRSNGECTFTDMQKIEKRGKKNLFEATLKNRSSAHFAPVTITFPIPEDQYEQAILALEKSQIGDVRVQDCLIDNVHAPNSPALNRMTGTMANVDELDWLGKQLESFDRYELLQFNAAVERFGLSAADELIDLSFCAREVTVVSDFNDLELVGKRH